jgi:hypothetical protein
MEYMLVSIVTIIIMFVFFKNINKLDSDMPQKTYLRQSTLFVKTDKNKEKIIKTTQSLEFFKKRLKKIMFTEDNAYWIDNNVVYKAKTNNDEIDNNTVEKVDIMTMDKVELDKMIFIIDKLTERN